MLAWSGRPFGSCTRSFNHLFRSTCRPSTMDLPCSCSSALRIKQRYSANVLVFSRISTTKKWWFLRTQNDVIKAQIPSTRPYSIFQTSLFSLNPRYILFQSNESVRSDIQTRMIEQIETSFEIRRSAERSVRNVKSSIHLQQASLHPQFHIPKKVMTTIIEYSFPFRKARNLSSIRILLGPWLTSSSPLNAELAYFSHLELALFLRSSCRFRPHIRCRWQEPHTPKARTIW